MLWLMVCRDPFDFLSIQLLARLVRHGILAGIAVRWPHESDPSSGKPQQFVPTGLIEQQNP